MMENQSFDRLFATFQSASGTPVDGIPTAVGTPGTPAPCLPDPRQTEVPVGVILSCERPYHVDYTPPPATLGPQATQTANAYRVQENLNDNPHAAQDSYTDTIGVPPTVGLTPGSIPTPMTGFLAAAWDWCNQPNALTGNYEQDNAACNTPTPTPPGPGTPTDTPTPLGSPTATLVPFDVMRYLNGSDVPYYWYFAGYYVLQDHLFEPVASYSLPAHLYMVSNWSAFCPLVDPTTTAVVSGTPTVCQNQPATPPAIINQPYAAPTGQPYPNYAWTDITYLLNNHQVDATGATVANGTPAPVSWGYYTADDTQPDCQGYPINCAPTVQPYAGTVEYWNPLQFFTTVHFDGTPGPGTPTPPPNGQGQLDNILKHHNFLDAAAAGTLPAVSWVVPAIDDSDHPPFSLDYGQEYVYELLYALSHGHTLASQLQWQHTAVFLMWDDWGGFYDHELPPSVDGNGYGIRVPGIVISQYAKHCAVDSQPMSFDALNRFIEDDFLGGSRLDPTTDGRPDPRGTAQPVPRETAVAGDLSNDFNFSRTTFPTPGPFGTAPSPAWCSN